MTDTTIQAVLQAEALRRSALMHDDATQVANLFADDLVYVHTTGLIHDKAQYLAYAANVVRYLDISRDQLHVRVYGEVAVMTGYQVNTLCKRSDEQVVRGEGFVTQVWVKGPHGWQISSFHGSRLPT
ncbi:MAG: nuclear transport factor 2 family protein [Pseudomonas sp.]|nr:nuclear transport factor 2 family protein [Pseudomonas sp.]